MAKKLGIRSSSCHGWIMGEHGCGMNVAGVSIQTLNLQMGPDSHSENQKEVRKMMAESAYEGIRLKGYTKWATGLSLMDLLESILKHLSGIHPVSSMVRAHVALRVKFSRASLAS